MSKKSKLDLTPIRRVEPKRITFKVFTNDEIKKLSVVEIRTPLIFDAIGQPLAAGLYDSVLGPIEEFNEPCGTCRATLYMCPGHLAHIEFPVPVINPLFYKTVYQILKLSCTLCHTIQLPESQRYLFITQLKLLDAGYITEAQEAEKYLPGRENDREIDSELEKCEKPEEMLEIKTNLAGYLKEVLSLDKGIAFIEESKTIQSLRNRYVSTLGKFSVTKEKCKMCKEALRKFSVVHNKMYISMERSTSSVESKAPGGKTPMNPLEAQGILRKLWENESELMIAIAPILAETKTEYPTDAFFLDTIPVIPSNSRPVQVVDSQMTVHPQTNNYKPIIQDCLLLRHLIGLVQGRNKEMTAEAMTMISSVPGNTPTEKLHSAWQDLQSDVDNLLDQDQNRKGNAALSVGLKQIIEKKLGCIRMHMMGKRVNYAARSVITPDPNLEVDEIGVPEVFALTLTYPTPVTLWNVAELRKMIINGPFVHPGAVMVENEDGTLSKISGTDKVQRETIAKRLLTPGEESNRYLKDVKVVYRHLRNGDILLLNRQPTLHRPSIMAHKARILKGEKTLRLNYANCKAYNADFDGDEMNAHFPQNELARSEAYTLANVCNNYLVPKDGTPLSGLIQDHVVSGVRMSMRGRFFNREDYHQLTFQALSSIRGDLKLLPPSILKPTPLWSGKQIISTVIINVIPKGRCPINLNASSKIGYKAWENATPRTWEAGGTPFSNPKTMSEAEVIIREGELMSGVLDKTHFGATPFGLVHCLYELYGGQCSSTMLSAFSKLFTAFLQLEGFTLGVEDILVVPEADEMRSAAIEESRQIGDLAVANAFDLVRPNHQQLREKLEESLSKNKAKWRVVIDRSYKKSLDGFTNVINKACLPAGLIRKFPANNLQLMVQSGAKGSTVNTMQISCLLGQIELEGKRPPLMISGKSLPSFPKFETSPRAGGFVDGRFLTGIQPQEFFFHCMAGREGLIDTAVKTSRSGYLQRCLVKHLEGLTVHYDQTVRDSDGCVVQYYYGEDGLDVMKAQFLNPSQMPFLMENAKAIIQKSELLNNDEVYSKITKLRTKIADWVEENPSNLSSCRKRDSPFTRFSADNKQCVSEESNDEISKLTGRSEATASMTEMWRNAGKKSIQRYVKLASRCPDPVMSKFQADRDFGTLTENMEKLMDDYVKAKSPLPEAGTKLGMLFREMMSHKSMKSLCPAGEPVGLLAAQSIGEPSTQMTLNTFHFAGRGDMNVTLGIPRLREILMVASRTMKTPSMDIPFHSDIPNLEERANSLKREMTRVTLGDLLEYVNVSYQLQIESRRLQRYTLKFQFLPPSMYESKYLVTPDIILHFMETKFMKDFLKAIKKREKAPNTLLRSETNVSDSDPGTTTNESDDVPKLDEETRVKKAREADVGEEHESSDEDNQEEDEDATMARTRARHDDQAYEDPEDEEVEVELEDLDDFSDEGFDEIAETDRTTSNEKASSTSKKNNNNKSTSKKPKGHDKRCQDMVNSDASVLAYDYDREHGLWCRIDCGMSVEMGRLDLSTLLPDVAQNCVLWEVPLIKRAFTYTSVDKSQLLLKTDGINISEMFKHYKLLDLNKLYTNDIHGMAATYGIEAARRIIVREVQDVFKMYGITVDPRHLLLIADYMTFNGVFEPLSRSGMEKNVSPLQQMSFESSINFLKCATVNSKRDHLNSPSSRLMIGRPCKSGTGIFQVIQAFTAPPKGLGLGKWEIGKKVEMVDEPKHTADIKNARVPRGNN